MTSPSRRSVAMNGRSGAQIAAALLCGFELSGLASG